MHPFKRSSRVSESIRKEVADIIMNKIKHKDLGFVTVTSAKASDDLKHAVVYVSVLNVEEGEKIIKKLNSTVSFIKGELGRRLKLRCAPTIAFKIDETIQYGMKIDKLLDDIKSERSAPNDDEDLF
ncbi:MAG: 30S ribosome-binding factor RbfA [Nitrospirae bacterium]|nr:30S ribosome-binding factor RbfA [Nitrospirota bacterium]